jgi:hypothetical protein
MDGAILPLRQVRRTAARITSARRMKKVGASTATLRQNPWLYQDSLFT